MTAPLRSERSRGSPLVLGQGSHEHLVSTPKPLAVEAAGFGLQATFSAEDSVTSREVHLIFNRQGSLGFLLCLSKAFIFCFLFMVAVGSSCFCFVLFLV